jgi:non-heme chloroperoxidase
MPRVRLSAEFLSLLPGFWSADVEECVRSLGSLLQLCFGDELASEDRYLMLGYNVSVPPHVRQALLARALDNDDLLSRLRTPVLVNHGAQDAVVKPTVIDQQMKRIASARIRMLPGRHACFWDNAAAYNRCLRKFAEGL